MPRAEASSPGGTVAVDGSKFKAVNSRDSNFTPGKVRRRIEQVEESIQRYLEALDTADRHEDEWPKCGLKPRLKREDRDAARADAASCEAMERAAEAAPDGQISLTDPDARSMATSGKGTGMVGYNVQAAVDAKHHLIVAHEVTNVGIDRSAAGQHGAPGPGQATGARRADGRSPIAATSRARRSCACEEAG